MTDQTTQPEQQAPSLTLNDLLLALNIIQASAQRGAIRAEEMSTVGGLHDRLYRFLDSQGLFKKQDAATAPAGDTTPADAPASE